MAAGDMTTLAAVKSWLNITTTNSDTLLGNLITAISAQVPGEIQRQLLTAQHVEVRQANGKDTMLLKQWPVQSISLVEWSGASLNTVVDLFSGQSGIATDGRSLILLGSCFPDCGLVRVTYTAGYDTLPADVVQAVNELVGEAYSGRTHIGETSHSSGSQTTVAFSQKDMGAAIRSKLNNYLAVAPLT